MEIQPLPWLLLNAAGRADYSSDAGFFFSPRVSLTFGFGRTDTLRLAFARSFRKPNFLEKSLHPNVTFPEGGPIQGSDQEKFREFLSRVGANPTLGAEELTAFELGYQRKWAHGIRTNLEFFANLYANTSSIEPRIVEQPNGLPDLDKSTVWFETRDERYIMLGAELIASWHELDWLWLEASWTMVGLWSGDFDRQLHTTPKNIFSLACDVLHPSGLLGSLVLSGLSEFVETGVFNPAGILEPTMSIHHPNSLHVQGRLGWRSRYGRLQFETGVKFMLPLSFDSDPLHTYDAAGVYTPEGVQFGGTILVPTVLAYVEGEL
ncbi:MAG: TonB-dependent receptor [Deltaproteobacteria bacterium]|nr:MAG: TonB-dependent receptor [Deltaproteobacteria bacterium]